MEPHEDPAERVLVRLRALGLRPTRSATGHTCRCPAHDDQRPSLKIDAGDRGVTLHCYAGCRTEDILVALKLEWKDLFYADDSGASPDATYEYTDEGGALLYQVVRWPGKRFSQRRAGHAPGEFVYRLGDVRRVPYKLPELLSSDQARVYVTEGEKDADAIRRTGAVATCAAGGAVSSNFKAEWAEFFRGRHVVVCADNDEPGRAYARAVLLRLHASAASCVVVHSLVGKDVYDLLGSGGSLADLVPLDQPVEITLRVVSWEDFRESSQEMPEMLIDGLWSQGAFGFIAGAPKARKTWLGLGMGLALAAGQPFLNHTIPEAVDVLYVALEGGKGAIRSRIGCLARGVELDPDRAIDKFHLMYRPPSMDLMNRGCAEALRVKAEEHHARIIFIDVLRAATVFDENSASDFSRLMHNLRPILNDGISIAMLHHFSKWGDTNAGRDPGDRMVGTGAMRGALDVGLYLTQVGGTTRVDSEARDLNMPDSFQWSLSGIGTGPNGGFTYRDTCQLKLESGELMQKKQATAGDIAAWIKHNGGSATPRTICAILGVTDALLRTMGNDLAAHGILPVGRGTSMRYEVVQQIGMPAA